MQRLSRLNTHRTATPFSIKHTSECNSSKSFFWQSYSITHRTATPWNAENLSRTHIGVQPRHKWLKMVQISPKHTSECNPFISGSKWSNFFPNTHRSVTPTILVRVAVRCVFGRDSDHVMLFSIGLHSDVCSREIWTNFGYFCRSCTPMCVWERSGPF